MKIKRMHVVRKDENGRPRMSTVIVQNIHKGRAFDEDKHVVMVEPSKPMKPKNEGKELNPLDYKAIKGITQSLHGLGLKLVLKSVSGGKGVNGSDKAITFVNVMDEVDERISQEDYRWLFKQLRFDQPYQVELHISNLAVEYLMNSL